MNDRMFRFGVQKHQSPGGPDFIESARRIEELGYDTLQVMDHFGEQLAPVPAMTAAAAATSTLRVGSLVLDNDYRHPVVLAKELATLDLLSGGRVEVGLGAGWMASDYRESGIPQDPPGVRVDRLEEALGVFKGLWGDGPVTHDGEHYQISAHDGTPKPVQRPHPPILIGGGGKRLLSIAAREADIVGINPNMKAGVMASGASDITAEAVDRKVELVQGVAGERLDELELHIMSFVVLVTDNREHRAGKVAEVMSITPAEVLASPYLLIGSASEIADDLQGYRDRWGISYYSVMADSMEAFAPVVAGLSGR